MAQMPQNAPQELIASRRTLIMASVNSAGMPLASYAPFVYSDGSFYVNISELAHHTHNLAEMGRASVMFIEDEASAADIFARQRYVIRCAAIEVARNTKEWRAIMKLFKKRLGRAAHKFSDFHLFQLTPSEGRIVLEFGEAWDISADTKTVKHVTAEKKD